MTNNIFCPNRFYQLVVRNLRHNPKTLLQHALIFAGLPLIFFLMNIISSNSITTIGITATMSLLISITFMLAPFIYFFNYNHPKKGLSEVMLPASVLEKYLVMQLTCLIIAPLSILILFGGMDSLLALLFPNIYEGGAVQQYFRYPINWDDWMQFFLIQQAILLCNLLFVKHKVLKTFGMFILVGLVFLTTAGLTVYFLESFDLFSGVDSIKLNFSSRDLFEFHINDHPLEITFQLVLIIIQILFPVALVVGSYFAMKTKRY